METESVAMFWDTLPHCCGYPNCDGDLVATEHSEGCPLFGRIELTQFEFAEAYANFRLIEARKQLAEQTKMADDFSDMASKYQADNDELRKKLAEREADTKRLEFWAESDMRLYRQEGVWWVRRTRTATIYRGSTFREAIDAAMKEKP